MTRLVSISPPGGSPAPTFEQPFEMLHACHERMQRMLSLLERLRAHAAAHGVDGDVREAARDVMRYFDLAAPHHHLDEELHVFPALRALGNPEIDTMVARLQDEHRRMDADWQAARAVLARLAAGGGEAPADDEACALDRFAALYDAHIHSEEAVAYPAAASRLDDAATRAMGEDMMRRRGAR
ncbi:hemerythrin domain-containing protein [Ramlibacter sp. AN1015]|uniref:hemerythrin domain-containing protein n=1 Tax=Ramlibacter sp. AN1015 TaxID=3133428 RepID=UPI0030BCB2EA